MIADLGAMIADFRSDINHSIFPRRPVIPGLISMIHFVLGISATEGLRLKHAGESDADIRFTNVELKAVKGL